MNAIVRIKAWPADKIPLTAMIGAVGKGIVFPDPFDTEVVGFPNDPATLQRVRDAGFEYRVLTLNG